MANERKREKAFPVPEKLMSAIMLDDPNAGKILKDPAIKKFWDELEKVKVLEEKLDKARDPQKIKLLKRDLANTRKRLVRARKKLNKEIEENIPKPWDRGPCGGCDLRSDPIR